MDQESHFEPAQYNWFSKASISECNSNLLFFYKHLIPGHLNAETTTLARNLCIAVFSIQRALSSNADTALKNQQFL